MEREARKQDILEMAATLFAGKGYHEVKVDEIAEGVGLSKGTIYLYFENKEKLFNSILTERLGALNRRLSDAVQVEADYEGKLKGFIATYLLFFNENEAFYKIVHSEKTRMSMDSHYELHEYWQHMFLKMFDIVIEIMQTGTESGLIRPLPPETMGLTLIGILNMIIYDRIYRGGLLTASDDTDLVYDLFVNGVKNAGT